MSDEPEQRPQGVVAASNKGGRPKLLHATDPRTLRELEGLGGLGCTIREAAAFFHVSERTVESFLGEPMPDGEEGDTVRSVVWETGHATLRISLRRAQMRLAEKNAAMAIFLGKNLLGQTDRQEFTGPDGKPISHVVDGAVHIHYDATDAEV